MSRDNDIKETIEELKSYFKQQKELGVEYIFMTPYKQNPD